MEFFNPLDIDAWKNLITEFDRKRDQFYAVLADIQKKPAANAALEAERQALLRAANTVSASIQKLMTTATTVRDWIKAAGKWFAGGSPATTMQGLGLGPLVIVVGLGAATAIVLAITDWLKKAAAYQAKNQQTELLLNAGATPSEAINAGAPAQASSAKIFGFDVRWLLAIGALAIAGPYMMKRFSRRR